MRKGKLWLDIVAATIEWVEAWRYGKKLTFFIGVLLLVTIVSELCAPVPLFSAQSPLEVFTREGCPHCAAAATFLTTLQQEQPTLQIVIMDVARDPAALQRLQTLAVQRGITAIGVPAFFVNGELLIGFASADTTGARLKALLDRPSLSVTFDTPAEGCVPTATPSCLSEQGDVGEAQTAVDVPLLGAVSVQRLGLPVFTLVIGLLDGFNPCAMWVLLFVLSLLVNLKDRAKMFLIGGTFVLVSGLAYFAFMAAWLNLFVLIGMSRLTQVGLGIVALGIGSLNVKDFFAFGRGPSLAIPAAAKPGVYAQTRRILQAENLAGALVSVVVLAVLVNVVELLCTAGFPALYTQILTMHERSWWAYYGYLALYNVAYMLDDALMLSIAVVTLSRHKLQEREGRWLKLVSGLVMVGLGALLLVRPQWLVL